MASEHIATIHWRRQNQDFLGNNYSREHTWQFDEGVKVKASASPHIVPLPWSSEAAVDPEEAFVASIASCHMLFFLSIAVERNLLVDSYEDRAIGKMAHNDEGKIAITEVQLCPSIVCQNADEDLTNLINDIHHAAHEACFIANSINTKIVINPGPVS